MIQWAGLIVALFSSLNIGASGTAASMGSAYGGRALRRRQAILLAAVFCFLGAWLAGDEVIRTVGTGIVPAQRVTPAVAAALLACSAAVLFTANLMGVPLSTSQVTVGAVVGAGLALGAWDVRRALAIAAVWAALPPAALVLAYGLCRLLGPVLARVAHAPRGSWPARGLALALAAGGCYEAFAAGMNNVANAMGPLVGAGIIDLAAARFWGGVFLALGALLLGGRVLETNGRRITALSLASGTVASVTAGTLVIAASAHGIPVPLTQAMTVAIIGTGLAAHGRKGVDGRTVRRVIQVWILSPVVSLVVCHVAVAALDRAAASAPWAPVVAAAAAVLLAAALLRRRLRREDRGQPATNSAGRGGDGRVITPQQSRLTTGTAQRLPGAGPVPHPERAVLLHDAGRPRG